jgi:hypothetical protein
VFAPNTFHMTRKVTISKMELIGPMKVPSDAAVIVNAEGIGVESPVLPAGKLFKIDVKLRLQLPLIDGAALDAAGNIAQHIVGVDEIV